MYEVDYALKHRLGFMTLTWPETKNRDLLVENIFEGYQHRGNAPRGACAPPKIRSCCSESPPGAEPSAD
jgi:hypothetical protein